MSEENANESQQLQQQQNDGEDNPLFLAYKDQFPCWPLLVSAVSLNVVATVGMCLNFGVIWTTVRCRTLHGTANWLLALCSLFELLHQHGHWLFLWTALSPLQHFIDLQLAVRLCTVSLFGLGCLAMSMAFTGLDRLLCVFFPTLFPTKIKPVPYLALICLCCCGFSLQLVHAFYKTAAEMPLLQVTGTIGDLLQGEANVRYSASQLTLNVVTIVLYLLVGVTIRLKAAPTSNSERNQRRVLRSLLAITFMNVGGYLLILLFLLFVAPLVESPLVRWFAMQALAVLTNLSAASNGPILYWTSKEYRKAFRSELGTLWRLLGISRCVVPAVTTTQTAVLVVGMSKTRGSIPFGKG